MNRLKRAHDRALQSLKAIKNEKRGLIAGKSPLTACTAMLQQGDRFRPEVGHCPFKSKGSKAAIVHLLG
jgi:hypothetical protein